MNHQNRYLLDSDILIEYLRGQEQAVKFIEGLAGDLLISTMTVAELFSGVRDENEIQVVSRFLSPLIAISVDFDIARLGGAYRRLYRQSHGVGLNDAIIAATAELNRAILVSFNKRHFPMITDLLVPYERV
jgi:predicted nucleic acid-binding protein